MTNPSQRFWNGLEKLLADPELPHFTGELVRHDEYEMRSALLREVFRLASFSSQDNYKFTYPGGPWVITLSCTRMTPL